MKELQGPMHTGTCMKSPSFQGLMFVRFWNWYARDVAVGILKSARLKHGDKVTQDFPVLIKAKKTVPYGLWVFDGNWVNGGLSRKSSRLMICIYISMSGAKWC